MKKLMLAMAFIATLISCTKKETQGYLDLDMHCSQGSQTAYKNIQFKVDRLILHKKDGDTVQHQNLTNSSKEIFFSIENPESIYLGNWKLEPIDIKHIELVISEMTVKKDSTYFTCKIPEYWKCIYKGVNVNLEPSTTHVLAVGLNLRETVVLDSANERWIKPVFTHGFQL